MRLKENGWRVKIISESGDWLPTEFALNCESSIRADAEVLNSSDKK